MLKSRDVRSLFNRIIRILLLCLGKRERLRNILKMSLSLKCYFKFFDTILVVFLTINTEIHIFSHSNAENDSVSCFNKLIPRWQLFMRSCRHALNSLKTSLWIGAIGDLDYKEIQIIKVKIWQKYMKTFVYVGVLYSTGTARKNCQCTR